MNILYNSLKEKYPLSKDETFKDIYISYVKTLYYYIIDNNKKENNIKFDENIIRFAFRLLIKNNDLYLNKYNMRMIYNLFSYKSFHLTLCEKDTLNYINNTFSNREAKLVFEIKFKPLF